MAYAIGMRATSLGASALLLAAAIGAALSVSYRIIELPAPDPAPIVSIEPAPPPPVPPRAREPAPPTTQIEILDPFELRPLSTEGPAQPSEIIVEVGPPPAVEITQPDWVRRPRDLGRYYPSRALARGTEGAVMLDCRVDVQGALDCAVASESPAGWGFGEAALRISRDYAMQPARRDGVAVEGRYRMRMPFLLD